jgi:hypothetical protein
MGVRDKVLAAGPAGDEQAGAMGCLPRGVLRGQADQQGQIGDDHDRLKRPLPLGGLQQGVAGYAQGLALAVVHKVLGRLMMHEVEVTFGGCGDLRQVMGGRPPPRRLAAAGRRLGIVVAKDHRLKP